MRSASALLWISGFLPSTWCSLAVNGVPSFSSAASIVQYSTGLNARISRSRSTIRRSATVCTRPAEMSLLHGLPQHRAGLVADQAIEHAARLLRVDLALVDLAGGARWRAGHRVLRDLVEEHAPDGNRRLAAAWDAAARPRATRWPRPRGQGRWRCRTSRDDFAALLSSAIVFSLPGMVTRSGSKPFSTSMPELLGRQVPDVTDRGLHPIAAAEILADRLRLGRRLDDHERRSSPPAPSGIVVLDGRGGCRAAAALGRGAARGLAQPWSRVFLVVVRFFLTAMFSVPSDCRPAHARRRTRARRAGCEGRRA